MTRTEFLNAYCDWMKEQRGPFVAPEYSKYFKIGAAIETTVREEGILKGKKP
jgi:hypothetical protein